MSEEQKDCSTCIHAKVCKYKGHFDSLSALGNIEFFCSYHQDVQDKKNTITQKKDLYPELSVDELSKMVSRKEPEDKDTQENKHGICSICGKEKERLFACNDCRKPVCDECGEFMDDLDVETGEAKEVFVCHGCRD